MNYQRPDQRYSGGRRYQEEDRRPRFYPKIPDWVRNGINADAVKEAETFGKELAIAVTSTQIRKVFNEIKEIEMRIGNEEQQWSRYESRIIMLKPKMAYLAKRENNNSTVKALSEMIGIFIDEILKESTEKAKLEAFKNFSLFFEAVLAYHRANEKK